MERVMLNISLRDKIPNTEIRRRTRIARQDTKTWSHKVRFLRPRETKEVWEVTRRDG